MTGTLENFVRFFTKVLGLLGPSLQPDSARLFFKQLGIFMTEAQENSIAGPLAQISEEVESLMNMQADLLEALEGEDFIKTSALAIELGIKIGNTIASFNGLASSIGGLSLPDVTPDVINELPGRIFNLLLLQVLDRTPNLSPILEFLDILETEDHITDENEVFTIANFNWSKLGQWLSSPAEQAKAIYEWGQGSFDGQIILKKLEKFFGSIGFPAILDDSTNPPKLDIIFADFTPALDLQPKGISTQLSVNFMPAISTINFEGANLEIMADFSLPKQTQITIQPETGINIIPPNGSSNIEGNLGINLITAFDNSQGGIVLLGQAGGSRLEVGQFSFRAGSRFNWNAVESKANGVVEIGGGLKEGKVLIDFGSGDGFISKLLSAVRLETNFDLGFGYAFQNGLFFEGSSELIIKIPVHFDLAVVEIIGLAVSIGIESDAFPVGLGLDLKGNLGPLTAVVEQIGIEARLRLSENNDGNLGPLDFDLGFKPPNGVGLSLDIGVVKGGGFLSLDPDRGEYAGALEFIFMEWIALKAIGLISTRMPDGSKGFSLLIIITVEFGSGIQLGFGFTLLGVGGLMGLNRTLKIEPLTEGVRTGAIESVMFPEDVIANAPKIISDLRRFFPPKEGIFLFGPMVKIGWGTPTLVSVSMGLILEFPSVKITILGVVKVALPTEELALIQLQVNFIGQFDPKQGLWFYAELFDSRILFLTLEGGFGLMINWGDNPNFVFTAGGFHPRYDPPPLPFPNPPRLAINILNESWARIRIEAYFAVTSNSVQFGARAELFFGVSAFNIDGHLGFDALFRFNPFFFSFNFSVGLSVKVFGFGLFSIGFSGLLEGPTPWHIAGYGSINVFILSLKVPFSATWGEEPDTALPPIEVLPLIQKELEVITNWEAVRPIGTNILVTLRQFGDSDNPAPLVLHPVGRLRVSQRKVPFNIILDKVGTQSPTDANKFTVNASIGEGNDLAIQDTVDRFATGEFKDLSKAEKLSRPGFELFDSGLEIAPAGNKFVTSGAVKRTIRYEINIIDNKFKKHIIRFFATAQGMFTNLFSLLFRHFLRGSAISKSPLSQRYQTRIRPNDVAVNLLSHQYAVAFTETNIAVSEEAAQFPSQTAAEDHLQQLISLDPNAASKMHVIPNTELNIAA